jgi:hypothetical protein
MAATSSIFLVHPNHVKLKYSLMIIRGPQQRSLPWAIKKSFSRHHPIMNKAMKNFTTATKKLDAYWTISLGISLDPYKGRDEGREFIHWADKGVAGADFQRDAIRPQNHSAANRGELDDIVICSGPPVISRSNKTW